MSTAVDDAIPAGARLVEDPAQLVEHFGDRPEVHIYAFCDLEEPFWSSSRWYRRGDAVVGVVTLPDGEGCAVYAVATRDPAGALELTIDLLPQLPPGQLITAPSGLVAALKPHRRVTWAGPHERHHLTDTDHIPAVDPRVTPLGPGDLAAVQACYDTAPGSAFFLPHMVDDETFVGVWDDRELIAVAGTHVVSDRFGCAAIGAVFTRPDRRGEGLGRAVTVGVLHRLLERGHIDVIGLNVASTNAPARAIYAGLGFEPVHEYDEAELA